MQKSFKYRIYPTVEQKKFLSQQFGAVRFVYNFFLANRKDEYLNNKKSLNYYDDAKSLTTLKTQDGYAWLYDINSQTLQASLRNLEVSYQNFFKKRSKFPQFHPKKNKQCIKIPQFFKIENNTLYIPKLKTGIDIILHQPLPTKPTCCFISKTTTNKYYVSFLCGVEIEQLPKSNKTIGIDLGLTSLLTTSDGKTIANPKYSKQLKKKLAFKQKQLSKKQKGSNKKEKARQQVALIHEQIANKRSDYLHKISKKLIDENQIIIAETLKVVNMMKNHKLAGSIQDASWGELLRQLTYKAEWYGRTFYQIDTFFPSSKTCNNCQYIVDDLPLKIREWGCPNCQQHNNRDINAALNIKDKGIKDTSGLGINSDSKQKLGEAFSSANGIKSVSKKSHRNEKLSTLCR